MKIRQKYIVLSVRVEFNSNERRFSRKCRHKSRQTLQSFFVNFSPFAQLFEFRLATLLFYLLKCGLFLGNHRLCSLRKNITRRFPEFLSLHPSIGQWWLAFFWFRKGSVNEINSILSPLRHYALQFRQGLR